jgi:hypothetical protein
MPSMRVAMAPKTSAAMTRAELLSIVRVTGSLRYQRAGAEPTTLRVQEFRASNFWGGSIGRPGTP